MGQIDPQTLAGHFAAQAPAMVLYARQWLGAAGAEDVVQEVFIRLMAQRSPPRNVRAWLYASVRNAAISHARGSWRRRRRERAVAASRPDWFHSRPDNLIDAASAEAALQQLPQRQREIIVLKIWGDLAYKEIADITGQPLSTVFDQYRTGLAAIRQKMESPCNTKTD